VNVEPLVPPPPVQNLGVLVTQFLTGQMSFLLPNHQCYWREYKALTPTSGLASSFLHLQSASWWEGHCSLYTGSPTPVPVM